ncbi:MAG: NAD-dependent deacylase [Desulfobulbaceae bacterium]|nr:NAD-dependent deacylase [Desulfobulbaceae bacterium]
MNIPENLIEILKKAKTVAMLTGAGVSAESGIKTFRDPDGLWTKFNPAELASIDGFMSNPELVWEWYQHRRAVVFGAKPNPGHYAIAEMEKLFDNFTLITQNVDRLHQRAGATKVLELHGNIIDNRCLDCNRDFEGETALSDKVVPRCTHCGGLIRPCVVWFGEMLPEEAFRQSEVAAMQCDVFFSVGTSGEVYPAASLPFVAQNYGAKIVEINPNHTAVSNSMDFVIRGTSSQVLPLIVEKLKLGVQNL